jgi:esterase/lipase superfamily enzyme
MPWAPREFKLSVRAANGDVADTVSDDGMSASNTGHILLLVHGYNNSEADATSSYKIFIDDMQKAFGKRTSTLAPDTVAKFHWPGDQSTALGTTVGYPFDITHARDSARVLARYLARLPVLGSGASRRITIVGHSMGCRLIFEALGQLRPASVPGIEIVGLMAGASPIDFVKRSGRLFRTGSPPRRMLKFYSEQDRVLQVGFPLGQWLAYQWQIENDNYSEAVGRYGHPPEFGTSRQTTNRHGQYWSDGKIAAFLVEQIDAATRTELQQRALTPPAQISERSLPTR